MITISGTFTVDPIVAPLEALNNAVGIPHPVELAPYNQVFQQLLDPLSAIGSQASKLNILLLRLSDFALDKDPASIGAGFYTDLVDELSTAFETFCARTSVPLLVALLPDPKSRDEGGALCERLQRLPQITLVTEPMVASVVDLTREADLQSEALGHIPYTDVGFAGLALALARQVHAQLVPAHKVLVLDCDNTLWAGVVGEDGVEGIRITPGFAAVQNFAIAAQQRGILICLASKNVEEDVLEVLAKRDDMLLKLPHIVAHRVNWLPKSQNLQSLAQELNLGLDSFVFLDDNPVECGQMREALPQVVTLQLPPEEEVADFLANLWVFDKKSVTEEDMRRTDMYRENRARQQTEVAAPDIGAFLASLALNIDIAPPSDDEWPRVSQLTFRTNQFNFTTVRRSETELQTFAQTPGNSVWRVRVSDRFGDYGLVGVMACSAAADHLRVDTFLLSCRVLGRGVEHAMLRHAAQRAQHMQLPRLDLTYAQSAKNEPARAFADSVAAAYFVADAPGQGGWQIPVDFGLAIAHRPGGDPQAVMDALRADGKKEAAPSDASGNTLHKRSERYQRLAAQWTTGVALQKDLLRHGAQVRTLAAQATAPGNDTERSLLKLWAALFNMPDLGVEDDYFALGGTSLMAARLFASIEREFGTRLRLTVILEAPTVRLLALKLVASHAVAEVAALRSLVPLRPGQGAHNFFFVHDGDGETLLYQNLARRLPAQFSVFGIEPHTTHGVVLAHASIEAMASHYIGLIKQHQLTGPYFLGGMCAGGVIAFEMAQQLEKSGHQASLVLMLDSAAPGAATRKERLGQERAARLQALHEYTRRTYGTGVKASLYLGYKLVAKIANTARWMVVSKTSALSTKFRFGLLQKVLQAGQTWPLWCPPLSVREIFDTANSFYRPGRAARPEALVLVRATQGGGSDIPFKEVYADDALGWGTLSTDLNIVDVQGGHASMLQEPYVEDLARVVTSRLTP